MVNMVIDLEAFHHYLTMGLGVDQAEIEQSLHASQHHARIEGQGVRNLVFNHARAYIETL